MSTSGTRASGWQRWVRQPQAIGWRKAVFQIHLWSGLAVGLYVLFISLTGSVLVYRNELYVAATPDPIISTGTGPVLSDDALTAAATAAWPGYRVTQLTRPVDPNRAVEVRLVRGDDTRQRYLDPRTGADVGSADMVAFWLVSKLIELHDDLLAGREGRRLNGWGAVAALVVTLTGLVIWWPGAGRWRRSLTLRRGVGWKRLVWDLHSAVGLWTSGFVLILILSGIYLCFPEELHATADWLDPPEASTAGHRVVDRVFYWLAYLHFGRINGIGIPCSGPGWCDQATKATWALLGLAPAAMFVTGAVMWWNRVVRPWRTTRARRG